MGLFKDWDVTNFTLKRKVKRKISKKNKFKKRKEPVNYEGRTYIDYLEYKINHPNIATTEMDTIYNNQSGPYIQTFIFENTETNIFTNFLTRKNLCDIITLHTETFCFLEALCEEKTNRKRV